MFAGVIPIYGYDIGFLHFSRQGSPGITSEQSMWKESGVPALLRKGRVVHGQFYTELAIGDRLYEGPLLLL